MAIPGVTGTTSGGITGSGSFTVALPSGAAGYLAIAHWYGSASDLTAPSGWTLLEQGAFLAGDQDYTRYGIWTGVSPGTSWSHGNGTEGAAVAVIGYDGALTVHQSAGTNGTGSPATAPSVTTTEAALIARLLFQEVYNGDSIVTYPSGHPDGQVTKIQHPGGADRFSVAAAHVTQSTPGASGTANWSTSSATIYANRAHTLALTKSDGPAGYLLLENGTDRLLLEDSSGVLLLEGVSAGSGLTATPADAVGITDGATAIADRIRATNDQLAIADAATAVATRDRQVGDPVGVTDSVAVERGSTATADDPVGITDQVTTERGRGELLADPVGVTDSAALTATRDRSASDNLGITDTATATYARSASAADPVGIGDQVTVVWDRARVADDAVGLTDVATPERSGTGAENPVDAVSVTDEATVQADRTRTPVDSLALADSAAAVADRPRSAADQLPITDSVSTIIDRTRTAADAVGATDSAAFVWDRQRSAADAVGITDQAPTDVSVGLVAAPADAVGLTDAVTALRTGVRSPADAVGLSDSAEFTWVRVRSATDQVGITDAALATIVVPATYGAGGAGHIMPGRGGQGGSNIPRGQSATQALGGIGSHQYASSGSAGRG